MITKTALIINPNNISTTKLVLELIAKGYYVREALNKSNSTYGLLDRSYSMYEYKLGDLNDVNFMSVVMFSPTQKNALSGGFDIVYLNPITNNSRLTLNVVEQMQKMNANHLTFFDEIDKII